jgi:hypothetical protein
LIGTGTVYLVFVTPNISFVGLHFVQSKMQQDVARPCFLESKQEATYCDFHVE